MKFNELYTEEKTRLDPACWDNKKIGKPKTKVKGGVRVNNCVPAESVEEDLSRRGFMQGLGMAAAGAAGLGAATDAQARATPEWTAKVERAKTLMAKGQSREQTARIMGIKGPNPGGTGPMFGDWGAVNSAAQEMRVRESVAEEYNAEYDDEAGMAQGSLHTLQNAVEGLQQVIDSGDNLPEWCQEKISLAEDYLVTVWDYIQSEKAQGMDPEITEMFEALEDLVSEMAEKNQVDEELVWESFEALPDNVLYETAAWRRKEGKSKKGGLNAKGVASYRRENPGSKLQMAVTTKPSKLKPGSKAAKRRKSFCARMSGVKGPMKKPNGKPTRKALALRKWNC